MKNPNMTSEANNYGPFAALPSVSSPLLPEMLDPLLLFHLLSFGTEDMIRESPETLKQAFQQWSVLLTKFSCFDLEYRIMPYKKP